MGMRDCPCCWTVVMGMLAHCHESDVMGLFVLCHEKYNSGGVVLPLCLSTDVFVRNSNYVTVWKARA